MRTNFNTGSRVLCLLLAGSAIAGCGATDEDELDFASNGEAFSLRCPADVDPTIAVPAGNRLDLTLDAIGVQIYACQQVDGGTGWVFQGPEADLLRNGRVVGSHYAGPTWEYRDGSTVVGTKLAAFNADPTSIPWLLLQGASEDVRGVMSRVTYIQRLDTVGGLAPAASECTTARLGELARVDYTATYALFQAGPLPAHCE